MRKTTSQRVRKSEALRRGMGEKEIRVWVPDNPEDINQVRNLAIKLRSVKDED